MKLPEFTQSLQLRLTIAFAGALALAISGVSIYSARATTLEIHRFEQEVNDARASRVKQLVANSYEQRNDWQSVKGMLRQAGTLFDWHILVADPDGSIVADSHPSLQRTNIVFEASRVPIVINGQVVGSMMFQKFFTRPSLRISPEYFDQRLQKSTVSEDQETLAERLVQADEEPPALPRDPPLATLASSFQNSLLWAGIIAGSMGLIIVSIGTRQALSPVRSLTSAARTLGKGDLSQRVPSAGSDEIGVLGQTFNDMAQDLESAQKRQRVLMADIAHELRTPLSNLQGYLEAIKDRVLKANAATIDTLYQQTLHISRLVEDLRTVALVEAGALRLEFEAGQLEDLVQTISDEFSVRAINHGVTLKFTTELEISPVYADRTRIRQVVANLLENALTHTPDGGSIMVSVSMAPDQSRVVLIVSDTGRGIAQEKLPYIFDQFYRADPSRSRETGGAGLGLTIAKRLVETHSGTISAESSPEHGTRITVLLPSATNVSEMHIQ